MTLPSIYIYKCLQYVRKHINEYPDCQSNHDHNTRSKEDLQHSFRRIYRGRSGMNYWALKFYNSLPKSVRQLPQTKFEQKIKKFLIESAFYCTDEYSHLAQINAEG